MRKLFMETDRQLSILRRCVRVATDSPIALAVFLAGVITAQLWKSGLFVPFVNSLPEWAQLPLMMPLFGSMGAIYMIGGMATLSLLMTAAYDLVTLPFRRARVAIEEG